MVHGKANLLIHRKEGHSQISPFLSKIKCLSYKDNSLKSMLFSFRLTSQMLYTSKNFHAESHFWEIWTVGSGAGATLYWSVYEEDSTSFINSTPCQSDTWCSVANHLGLLLQFKLNSIELLQQKSLPLPKTLLSLIKWHHTDSQSSTHRKRRMWSCSLQRYICLCMVKFSNAKRDSGTSF